MLTGSRQAPRQLARRQDLRDLLHGRHAHARAPAPAAEQSACFPGGLLPTATSQSASIAQASPRTTTAPAAARKPSTTARTPAPAAHSGTTSPRCCASTSPRATETTAAKLLAALCGAQRPESILTWLRKTGVRELLERLATGDIPLSHEALDKEPNSLRVEHMRSLLTHHKLLPDRDHYLALFERWLTSKLDDIDDPEVRRPVESFARWHHLRRIRSLSADGKPTRGPVHSAKQEITETIKFLTWLKLTHGRTVASCVQADVDAWLADGPTTRHAIRTFFVWAVKNRTCTNITIGFRQAKTVPLLTQGQRLAMLKACLTDNIDTLPYRVAATLLLLYAQPVVKIAAMKSTDVILTPDGLRLSLGEGDPAPVPEPFASLLTEHLASRPNMRTGSSSGSEWLFPGYRPGQHIHPNTLMVRLREIGINLLGARNASLRAPRQGSSRPARRRNARLQLPSHPETRRSSRRTLVPLSSP